jgi:serine/threonine protein phosphatase PrpC
MDTVFVGQSDVGLVRERNEDSFLLFSKHRFAAVADGMGGHLSGDVASSVAIATMQRFYEQVVEEERSWPLPYDSALSHEENCMVVGVRWANSKVFSQARKVAADSVMGTTIVAAMFSPSFERVVVAHVGDSRCYRLRGGKLLQLTTDHSLVSEVTEIAPWLSAEEIAQLPSNVITRALGMGADVVVDLLSSETAAGDIYLLCSDGLNSMLTDSDIGAVLDDDDISLKERCDALIRRANQRGGVDNTTVALVAVRGDNEDLLADTLDGGGDVPVVGGAIGSISFQFEDDEDTAPHALAISRSDG